MAQEQLSLAYSVSHDPEVLNPQGRCVFGSVLISTGRIIDRSGFDDIRARSDKVELPRYGRMRFTDSVTCAKTVFATSC